MPKDEFDFDDPMELNGVGLVCAEDTTEPMTECFIEEFMRLGYNHKQILALFRNPYYIGMHMAVEKRGEQFIREKLSEAFALRGKPIVWPSGGNRPEDPQNGNPSEGCQGVQTAASSSAAREDQSLLMSAATSGLHPPATDPTGAPPPDFTI